MFRAGPSFSDSLLLEIFWLCNGEWGYSAHYEGVLESLINRTLLTVGILLAQPFLMLRVLIEIVVAAVSGNIVHAML